MNINRLPIHILKPYVSLGLFILLLLLPQCGPSTQLTVQKPDLPLTMTVVSTPFEEKVESSPTKTRVLATKGALMQANITPTVSPNSTLITLTITVTPQLLPSTTPKLPLIGQIAFRSKRDGNAEIYLMNTNGSKQTPLTHHLLVDEAPAWSPDGQRLAFASEKEGNFEIYIMTSDGSQLIRLTEHPAHDFKPVWSPNGEQIAFVSDRDGNSDIYVMNADGTEIKPLTTYPGFDSDPAWSPDGKTIIFSSSRDCEPCGVYPASELYLMNHDGSHQRRLTNVGGFNRSPVWSPDGLLIAFSSTLHGDRESKIYLYNTKDKTIHRLTESLIVDQRASEFDPAWSPTGQFMAFTLSLETDQIYLVDIEGTQIIQLTDGEASNAFPAWRPSSE